MQGATVGIMEPATDKRIQARDAATRMLNRLTAGLAFGAIAGVGILSTISAYTVPGNTTAYSAAAASTATSSGTASTGVRASQTPVSSSSGSGVAVSGGS